MLVVAPSDIRCHLLQCIVPYSVFSTGRLLIEVPLFPKHAGNRSATLPANSPSGALRTQATGGFGVQGATYPSTTSVVGRLGGASTNHEGEGTTCRATVTDEFGGHPSVQFALDECKSWLNAFATLWFSLPCDCPVCF